MTYLVLKTIHLISAGVLFGTGLGTAFLMFATWCLGERAALPAIADRVVQADWLFTLPAVIAQPVTGIWLMAILGYSFTSAWFAAVMGLYGLIGACWIPVVAIQLRLARLARDLDPSAVVRFDRLMRLWTTLGTVAFTAVLGLFVLMVFKPGLA
jgi:uncharacterized membrane protein